MDLSFLKRALENPEIYPDHPHEIHLVETYISLVSLTGRHAYKIKKPVNFGFLDFSTLERRRFFCEEELRLNRRLAPAVYLGVLRLTERDGKISFEGLGEVIDYVVKMEQIPEESLMNRLLDNNKATPEMMEAISEKLVQFYASAKTSPYIESFARPERVKQDTDENFEQTKGYIGRTISREIYGFIRDRTNQFLKEKERVFYGRIGSHRIRDCHGDLRLEHIFWGKEIAIIDCIEFSERFRYTDVAADIAFLAMDVDFHGKPEMNEPFLKYYLQASGDESLPEVLDFYKCYRAYVRGKVDSFQLDDPDISKERKEEAFRRTQDYFNLSYQYAQRL